MYLSIAAIISAGIGNACEKLTRFQQIEVQFAKATVRIKAALISNKVAVGFLIEQLCAISVVKSKKVPLFDKGVFERINSINKL